MIPLLLMLLAPADPFALAGLSESPDGRGGSIGMNITLDTETASHDQQRLLDFVVDIYHQGAPQSDLRFNYFASSGAGALAWDGHRLVIHLHAEALPQIDVDLTWQESAGTWRGLLHRDDFRAQTLL